MKRSNCSIYLAGPLFTAAERLWNKNLAEELRQLGYVVFLPQDTPEAQSHSPDPYTLFKELIVGLYNSNIVLANFDGSDVDSGTSWEVGYAYAVRTTMSYKSPFTLLHERAIFSYRTDFRKAGEDGIANLMLSHSTIHLKANEQSTPKEVAQLFDKAMVETARI